MGLKLVHSRSPATSDADRAEVLRAGVAKSVGIGSAAHPVALYLASLGKDTRKPTAGRLRTIAQFFGHTIASCPWHLLRFAELTSLRTTVAERYEPAYANQLLGTLKRVLYFAYRAKLLDRDAYEEAIDVPRVAGRSAPAGRHLPPEDVAALVDSCEDRGKHELCRLRDRALLAVLKCGGLRRAEATWLELEHLDRDGVLTIHGKGNKVRQLALAGVALETLELWLDARGREPGPMFCPVVNGRAVLRRISGGTVYAIVQRRARQAGIARCSPHDFRRTLVSDLLELHDAKSVRDIVGHESIETTIKYDRRPAARLAAISRTVDFPRSRQLPPASSPA